MPIDEPSRGGLTTSGRPSTSGTARSCSRPCSPSARRTKRGVGRPSASQTRLVITLSIAIADAITPEPVYGIAEQLERALDAAVLAVAAVQGDEAAREAVALELAELALGRIEGVRVDALRLGARRGRRCR